MTLTAFSSNSNRNSISQTLPIRRLHVTLDRPHPKNWANQNPVQTAFLGALSMSFPVGEQFFMDSVRSGVAALSEQKQKQFADTLKGFVGQEATHRRLHTLYNAELIKAGIPDVISQAIGQRISLLKNKNVRHALGVTAAYEHFTAVMSEWALRHHERFGTDDSDLKRLWMWHCSEEIEHRSVAFDVYQACGGDHAWRVKWYKRVLWIVLFDTIKQSMAMLRAERQLWSWKTLSCAADLLFGKTGLVRTMWPSFTAYLKPTFHPLHSTSFCSQQWLNENSKTYTHLS
jgi:uncharacterized protein